MVTFYRGDYYILAVEPRDINFSADVGNEDRRDNY